MWDWLSWSSDGAVPAQGVQKINHDFQGGIRGVVLVKLTLLGYHVFWIKPFIIEIYLVSCHFFQYSHSFTYKNKVCTPLVVPMNQSQYWHITLLNDFIESNVVFSWILCFENIFSWNHLENVVVMLRDAYGQHNGNMMLSETWHNVYH